MSRAILIMALIAFGAQLISECHPHLTTIKTDDGTSVCLIRRRGIDVVLDCATFGWATASSKAPSTCQSAFQGCRSKAGGVECWNSFHECTGYAADCRAGLIHSVGCPDT